LTKFVTFVGENGCSDVKSHADNEHKRESGANPEQYPLL